MATVGPQYGSRVDKKYVVVADSPPTREGLSAWDDSVQIQIEVSWEGGGGDGSSRILWSETGLGRGVVIRVGGVWVGSPIFFLLFFFFLLLLLLLRVCSSWPSLSPLLLSFGDHGYAPKTLTLYFLFLSLFFILTQNDK